MGIRRLDEFLLVYVGTPLKPSLYTWNVSRSFEKHDYLVSSALCNALQANARLTHLDCAALHLKAETALIHWIERKIVVGNLSS